LTECITGQAKPHECVHWIKGSKLMIMPVGTLPPNPLELLLSSRFEELLAVLRRQVEIVIIDSPPVNLVSDALVIAPKADGTIFVVKAMDTPQPLARQGLVRIQRAGGKIVGIVVNKLDFVRARKYYGESAGLGAGSYGGYGENGSSGPDAAPGAGAQSVAAYSRNGRVKNATPSATV
jgi:capsular exopolysaccharide synthesis family protein